MQHYEHLLYRTTGSVARISMNRPAALNALNQAMLAELQAAFAAAAADDAVQGVIITGEGKAFAAGADIGELASAGAIEGQRFARYGQQVFDSIERLGKPVIAAVNGHALGGGCELAMACTLRIASEQAAFGQSEVTLGVLPGFGATQRLPRLVGIGPALQMILSAAPIDAREACRIGLANEVVAADDLIARAEAILRQIVANAPLAVRPATAAEQRGTNSGHDQGLALKSALFAICAASEDTREGTQALLARRAPQLSKR